ncbi:MAG: hypothetical protein QW450_04230 [Candidatus Nitrosocaldus sp.]
MSMIRDVILDASSTRDKPIVLDLRFRIDGRIRELFTKERWLDAYEHHDNLFRIKYAISIKKEGSLTSKDIVEPITFVRKASIYWSRDPTMQPYPPEKKVWVMIVADQDSILPRDEDEARSLLFDVHRRIEIMPSMLGKGKHDIFAEVSAEWGKHVYAEADMLTARSNNVRLEIQ